MASDIGTVNLMKSNNPPPIIVIFYNCYFYFSYLRIYLDKVNHLSTVCLCMCVRRPIVCPRQTES